MHFNPYLNGSCQNNNLTSVLLPLLCAGNLLATRAGDLVYLDFGMMSEAPQYARYECASVYFSSVLTERVGRVHACTCSWIMEA